jgi:hypothetical protein
VQEGVREKEGQMRKEAQEVDQGKEVSMLCQRLKSVLGNVRRPRGSCAPVLAVLASLLGVLLVATAPAYAVPPPVKPFGITKFTNQTTERTRIVPLGGEKYDFVNEPYTFTQAGGHPWALTTAIEFTSEELNASKANGASLIPTQDPKDIVVDLPPGLLGDPMAAERCPLATALGGECPASSQVGVYRLRAFLGHDNLGPIVNVVPEAGQSAEFVLELEVHHRPVLTGHLVRTPQGYGFTVVSNGIPEASTLVSVETTFWGVPADPSHDPMRGLKCAATGYGVPMNCDVRSGGKPAEVTPVPFLTMGTDCAVGPETATVRADSWEEPGSVGANGLYSEQFREASARMPGVTGCNLLQFNPEIEVLPDSLLADEPVGLGVNVNVPLSEEPGTNATPQLRNAVVTLPEGMSVSPGVVDGIQACQATGPEGINIEGPESEEVGLNGEWQLAPGHCPDASTVGTAEAFTPFLPVPVKGHVYLARPGCGGPGQSACTEQDALDGNLYQLYLELGGTGALADTGVHIKVAGKTEANPATGQLTTKFLENPQAPFSKLEIHLNGGPRAPIANPAVCGAAVTTADFMPWSAPGTTQEGLLMAGTQDATPSSFFDVGGCASPRGLAPGFVAGTVTPQAGAFSAFTLSFSRQDREQFVKGVQVHTPPGLLGMLSSVQLCQEPEADLGHCPESSKIGTTRVASGAGSHPFEIEGTVYLTGPHDGAPFGLSVVTPAVAGPFNLGLVVVRARIDVDPESSTLTVTTDESGPYALPQIIFGVPLRLKRITVNIDRANFMFNPTNCGAPGQPGSQQVTARVAGSENAVASVQSQFAVGGCQSLAFKPRFVVSTSGHTSRAGGASLDAKLSYPAGSVGSEANIARVKVDLPKQLPSRLTTLQKACTAQTFASNPANCPAASIVGIVKASTPLLPVGLSGPVYFVSHGGEAFPSLIVVLQGDGVRVDLVGSTFISKAGITSSTFKTVPDVPVGSFELYLPEGKYSALAANGNLCALTSTVTVKRKVTQRVHGRTVQRTITTHVKKPASLLMPTEFVAQNGAVLKQSTKIEVTECPKAEKAKAKTKTKAKRASKAGHGRTY